MRPLLVLALTWLAASTADAQPAAPAAASAPICTTTTTVVKRGDVVLSSNSSTRCDSDGGGEGGLHPGAVLGSLLGAPRDLAPREVRGEWRTVQAGARRVCHVTLLSETSGLGRGVRTLDCREPLARAAGWKLEDNQVVLVDRSGAQVIRLSGGRDRLEGRADGGPPVVLQR